MFYEFLLQGIFRYKEFLTTIFPYVCLGIALTTDVKVRSLFLFLIISGLTFQFIPTIDNIRDAQAYSEMEKIQQSKDVIQLCQAATKRQKIK